MTTKFWFDIKRSGDSPDNTAVNFRVEAIDFDAAVVKVRQEAGANFGQAPHRVWIIRGGEITTTSMTFDEACSGIEQAIAEIRGSKVVAPYTARQCPICHEWVYVADGPFAEGDPTKTEADYYHWAENHATPEELTGTVIGFPYFSWNSEPVEVRS